MADLDVLGLGLATLDVLMRVEHIRNWERPRGMSEFGLDGGGPGGTACVAAARLGARVSFIGTAGTDVAGELKLRFLAERGVDLTHVHRIVGPETQVVAVYVHERTGERVFLVLDALWTTEMPLQALDRAYVSSARFLHLDGYYPPALCRPRAGCPAASCRPRVPTALSSALWPTTCRSPDALRATLGYVRAELPAVRTADAPGIRRRAPMPLRSARAANLEMGMVSPECGRNEMVSPE